ncbi:DUF305 domain-containing protein [Devosia sp. ZB163]|uniref:CopM family metallochaperone n=1 Tax=Devosia sp. ZB163 TaxID=3025938 RepID=UPI00235EB82F|nr:DUF305 domain-containing protein [Devosia sp. ZB163]MDC9824045.1 DUF305 domain-containing protein [Devosia sp. ZB163]
MLKRLIATAALIAVPGLALAQDHSGHTTAAATDLPAICLANAPAEPAAMAGHAMGGSPAHQDLMDGMDQMNADMMAGGTAADIDVAFVCSMIPHHRGAIDMAEAELAHGDDPWARELAQAVVTAQEKEIADMIAWLEKQGK